MTKRIELNKDNIDRLLVTPVIPSQKLLDQILQDHDIVNKFRKMIEHESKHEDSMAQCVTCRTVEYFTNEFKNKILGEENDF